MKRPRTPFTIGNMVMHTGMSARRVEDALERAERVKNDTEKEKRLGGQKCKACHYWPAIGGAAMTTKPCSCCGVDQMYASTCTGELCMNCAKKHKLCRHCGGDIEMRRGRRNWPKVD